MNFNTLKIKTFTALLAIAVSVFLTGSVRAQSGTTGIKGAVKDQQGAAIPGS